MRVSSNSVIISVRRMECAIYHDCHTVTHMSVLRSVIRSALGPLVRCKFGFKHERWGATGPGSPFPNAAGSKSRHGLWSCIKIYIFKDVTNILSRLSNLLVNPTDMYVSNGSISRNALWSYIKIYIFQDVINILSRLSNLLVN